jgi:DnaK suppressor protein
VSKTPAKSVTPAKTAAKKATANAAAPTAPAKKAPSKPAPAQAAGAKPERKAAPAKSAPAKPKSAAPTAGQKPQASRPEMATAVVTEPAGSEAGSSTSTSRFADRFSPAKPASRIFADSPMDSHKPAVKSDPKLANAWKSKSGRDLSEEELLAMPESEYMNEKQLDFFRARLQALKDDLLSNAGETTEHLREDTSIVPDPADRATIEEEHALELRTRDRERKLLKKIAQSLARIDAGDYGFCDETGEPIGLGRLIARPTATLSLEAQQRREMKQKMFGD